MTARRVLWVDDEPHLLRSPAELIQLDLGWELAWESDLEGAVARLSAEPFDVVLVDQMFPVEAAGGAPVRSPDIVACGPLLIDWLRRGAWNSALHGAQRVRGAPWVPAHDAVVGHGNDRALLGMITAFDHTEAVAQVLETGPVPVLQLQKPIDELRLERALLAHFEEAG
jgi:CheY-like chemotaxis protein